MLAELKLAIQCKATKPLTPSGIVVMAGSKPIGVVSSAELRRVYAQLQRMEIEAEALGGDRLRPDQIRQPGQGDRDKDDDD